jgi:hypothetical protein
MGPKSKIVLAALACTLMGAAALPVGAQQSAASEPAMVGTWKLVSFQSIADGEPPRDAFSANPKGYLIVTREGRLMTVITAGGRKAGTDDAERAALQKSMLSYSGRYRLDGDLLITTVDVSWNEAWNGTEQKRHFRFEGDKLLIDTVRQPSVVSPGKMAIGRLVWEREK